MNIWFLMAGLAAFCVCGLHIVVGGRTSARPLLDATSLGAVPKYTNYYCWHMVSIVLAAMGGMFLWAASHTNAIELAYVSCALAAAFMFWSFGIVAINKGRFAHFPQWALFAVVTVLGCIGLL